MKLIVVGERSGKVRDAFAAKGHDAWSCDLLIDETRGNHLIMDNDMHLKDTLYSKKYKWEMMIAHPPCTALANSGVWYYRKRHELIKHAAIFFNMVLQAPIKRKGIENPIHHKYAREYIRRYDQIIQPWQFGDDASKATCLWLVNLPRLQPTNIIIKKRYSNQTPTGQNNLPPSPDRAYLRAKTYQGIAEAMADQWSFENENNENNEN